MGLNTINSRMGRENCVNPCGEINCGSCTDCPIPFVNAAGTATRYPQVAILSVSCSSVYNNHVSDQLECGLCSACALGTGSFACNFGGIGLWDFNIELATGPFIFGGNASKQGTKCTGSYLEPLACGYPASVFVPGNPGSEKCEGDGVGSRQAAIELNLALRLIQAVTWGCISEQVPIGELVPALTKCGAVNQSGLVLPESISMAGSCSANNNPSECGGPAAFSISFTDWVETPLPQ